MNIWNIVSLLLEACVVALGLALALGKKKSYGWLIALTFAIYVFYDLARFLTIAIAPGTLDVLFAVASLSIFLGVWSVYSHAK
jgi:hypothetical protein